MRNLMHALMAIVVAGCATGLAAQEGTTTGYYRQPALHGDTIVFVSEADLWKVDASGGAATRLTTHAAAEVQPVISPDGDTVAFVASYEGPVALYTMPISGGRPTRMTWDSARLRTVGWTPEGRLLLATDRFAGLPDMQLVSIDLASRELTRIPLAQADDGCYDATGTSLFFTRYRFQGSRTKRYTGGTAQRLWRFDAGADEAVPLTADYPGTSRDPMWWQGRVYFASDRDGTMNLYSMLPDGSELAQHTHHVGWDVLWPSLSEGRVAYQLGADLRLLDLATGADEVVPITLVSDFDQTREHWVKPTDYLSSVHLAPDGERVVLTARGKAFVVPRKQGRLVGVPSGEGTRLRDVQFLPDGERLLALSDASGEVELWSLPADGIGEATQLTDDGEVLRWEAVVSPDGKWVAHHDKNNRLWLTELASKTSIRVDHSELDRFSNLVFSPDSRWLAYCKLAPSRYRQVHLYHLSDKTHTVATSDRFEIWNPSFTADGKWLTFLSDRHFESVVKSPWGELQPEPFFDRRTTIFLLGLQPGQRSPFAEQDELHPPEKKKGKEDAAKDDHEEPAPVTVEITLEGLERRLIQVPAPRANMYGLVAGDGVLFWLERATLEDQRSLKALELSNDDPEPVTVAADITAAELSANRKQLLIRKKDALYIVDAKAAEATLDEDAQVDLSAWSLSVQPRQEWRQMLVEAWRLERDYFYDRGMHGVDWEAVRDRYLPLVDRVRCRGELADLTAQMVSELSAIHTFVYGGDYRTGDDNITIASLGAVLVRDTAAGGDRVEHVFRSDPDEPQRRSPLADPLVAVENGDVITHVDGVAVLRSPGTAALLRTKVNRQVRLRVVPADGTEQRDVIVTPISFEAEGDLRYHEWEYTRRLRVEEQGDGEIGYVHLRAMGADDIGQWARDYYPVHHRQGLIVDVRHNRGGNIDSWIVEKLARTVWGAWSDRVARPIATNMQQAFRGHLVVLCDAFTASDGEAFLEAIRRLQLGPIIGTRTWGGGIWLTSSNRLVDGGIATAAEFGLFGPEGQWLIEMDGVTPDIEVDNLPHATFAGQDAQLDAAIELLKTRIAAEPVPPLQPPPSKDLSRR